MNSYLKIMQLKNFGKLLLKLHIKKKLRRKKSDVLYLVAITEAIELFCVFRLKSMVSYSAVNADIHKF